MGGWDACVDPCWQRAVPAPNAIRANDSPYLSAMKSDGDTVLLQLRKDATSNADRARLMCAWVTKGTAILAEKLRLSTNPSPQNFRNVKPTELFPGKTLPVSSVRNLEDIQSNLYIQGGLHAGFKVGKQSC